MLKVGEHLAFCRPPAQGTRNRIELHRGVFTLAESVACEGSGHNIRRLQIVAFGNAERGPTMPQNAINVVAKPCAVPKFESHPQPASARIDKERVEPWHIRLEIGRQLEEHHTHSPRSHHRRERTRQGDDCVRAVPESKNVSEPLRSFEGETKASSACCQPAREHALGRQLAEGIVHLDRVQLRRIVFEELLLRKRLWVESRLPGRVGPTGSTNECPALQASWNIRKLWNSRDPVSGHNSRKTAYHKGSGNHNGNAGAFRSLPQPRSSEPRVYGFRFRERAPERRLDAPHPSNMCVDSLRG